LKTLQKQSTFLLNFFFFTIFQALGTHWGAVHILDFEGNVIKSFRHHSATVNDISIDKSDEFVASASDDGNQKIYTTHFKPKKKKNAKIFS
jgi:WD40 repeat protein